MHIAFHRGHEDFALGFLVLGFLGLNIGNQMRHRLLHDPGTLDHLGQEHLAIAEQVADHVHAIHQRPFNHLDGMCGPQTAGFGVINDVGCNALDQRVLEALFNRPFTPGQILLLSLAAFALVAFGDFQQAIGGIIPAIQDNVLNQFLELRVDLIVNHQLAWVHDTHVHAGLDGVVQEHGMNGLPYHVIAAEREGHVAHAT